MSPATRPPDRRDDVRLMVVDPDTGVLTDTQLAELADLLAPGDLLVVNDAATLPASLLGVTSDGAPIEVRLVEPRDDATWRLILFGAGDWHTRTEDRLPPPYLGIGDRLSVGDLTGEITWVSPVSPRLVDVRFDRKGAALWSAVYRYGRPVQYSYLEDELDLWSVQTVYAGRPWAVEMPSAGRPLTWGTLLRLRARGIGLGRLTHAAGLSSTGDPTLDAALPAPERYELPLETVERISQTRAHGGRVIAVGTTVVRALESAARKPPNESMAGRGVADLVIANGFLPRVVDGMVSGLHEAAETHFRVLGAFASISVLHHAIAHAAALGYRTHEFGDVCLVLPGPDKRHLRAA